MISSTIHVIVFLGIVTDGQYAIIVIFCCLTWIVLSLLGIVSNVINIKTFVAMGLNDGVTVSFLALSVFDLIFLIASFCQAASASFNVIETSSSILFPVDPFGVTIFFGNVMILINVTNVLSTTFIAVARCMCVAKPLHFKNSFTVKRTVYFMAGFAFFAVAIYTPVLANMGMVARLNNKTKMLRSVLWLSPFRESIKNVVWMLIDMILPVITEFVVLFCVLVMANSLRASSRFRQSSVAQQFNKHIDRNQQYTKDNQVSSNAASDKLSVKDSRVIMQVVLISLVYIICNTPKFLVSTGGLIEPEFRLGKRYSNLYLSFNCFRKHFEIINASINTFIYYGYNTKFRSIINTMCRVDERRQP